ncbi:MAG: DUF4136 domain-containing protein [Actinomycetota bacterium]|nr:DUF4136 domain-containing protein [Actinomycetota bacterium]
MLRSSLTLALLTALLVVPASARVKVDIAFDKTFDFSKVKTWSWNPEGPGEVKMARTKDDDPDAMKAKSEPWILSEVAAEMAKRGLSESAAPDVSVKYYLLLSTTMNSQVMGQFLPGTTAWAMPPFLARTQSMEILNQGSLVLDMTANGAIVWRGVAQAQIKLDTTDQKREALVREGVRDLLRRFPPKP